MMVEQQMIWRSTQRGTDVEKRPQRIQQQYSTEFTVLLFKTLVFDADTFVKFAKETTGNFKVISKFVKM